MSEHSERSRGNFHYENISRCKKFTGFFRFDFSNFFKSFFQWRCRCIKHIPRYAICLGLALGVAACGGGGSRSTIKICDPECSERPVSHINQDLRVIEEDDGRMAALEAEAAHNPQAAYDLALRCFRGDGVRRDTYKAISLMRQAAEKGDLNAQKALGSLYMTGLGEMGRDPGEAQIWLSIAAGRGDEESKQLLADADAAGRAKKDEFEWLQRWKPLVNRWWYSGYLYYGAWNGRAWYYGHPVYR